MITGVDYTFISNTLPNIAKAKFRESLSLIWQKPIMEVLEHTGTHRELFWAKNKVMSQAFDQKGYVLDAHGEGCFMLGARKIDLLQGDIHIQGWKKPKKMVNIEPYDSHICLKKIWEYSLVLPSQTNDSKFCKTLYDFMISALS